MKKLGLILLSCSLAACTTYKSPEKDTLTLGKASITKCQEMVWPEGMADGKEAIGFGCERQESDHIGSEAGAIIDAAITAISNHIPGLALLNRWLGGK